MHNHIDLVKNIENLDDQQIYEIKQIFHQILKDNFKEAREKLVGIMNGDDDTLTINNYYYVIMSQFLSNQIMKIHLVLLIVRKGFEVLCILAINQDLSFFDTNELYENPFSSDYYSDQKERINQILDDNTTGFFMKYYLFLTQNSRYYAKDFVRKDDILDFSMQIDYALHSKLDDYVSLVPERYFEKIQRRINELLYYDGK